MSLFSSIQMANNSLRAQQIGLQVAGQNIANAGTPGYSRAEMVLTPAPTHRSGALLLGLGVNVSAIVQKIDVYLEQRLRGAVSDRADGEVQEQTFLQLESLLGELSDTDISTSLNNFLSSIQEILNQPESASVRNLAVLNGRTLASDINRLATQAGQLRTDLDKQITGATNDVNRLLEEVRVLNVRIAQTEGGDVSASDAVGLRDQRNQALAKLAELIDVRVEEQSSGMVSLFSGGDYLVVDGVSRQVEVTAREDRGMTVSGIKIAQVDGPLRFTSGKIAGLFAARDEVVGGFVDQLDSFAGTLAFEFNKLFSSGQGLAGYTSINATSSVRDSGAPLDAAGLPFTPVNGTFEVQVYNTRTGLTQTTSIKVDLDGFDTDTSLDSLATQLSVISGVTATVSSTGRLTIKSDSAEQQIAFNNDTSGTLAALGVGTFFTGSSARSLGVNQLVIDDPARFSASTGGIGANSSMAEQLGAFLDRPLTSAGGASIATLYDRVVASVTQGSSVARAVADGSRVYEESLRGQQMSVSGVNIDEEVVRMMQYQRNFQASAKYIATLHELMDLLVNL